MLLYEYIQYDKSKSISSDHKNDMTTKQQNECLFGRYVLVKVLSFSFSDNPEPFLQNYVNEIDRLKCQRVVLDPRR